MRRETGNVLLVLLGGALVKITSDGTCLRYVKPSVQPFVLTAGIVIIGLALFAIARDVVAPRSVDDHCPRSVDDHHHGGGWAWLMVLPVLAIFVVAPPALGADTVLRAGNRTAPAVTRQGAAAFPPLPAAAVVPLAMSEFVTRSVWDSSHSLAGRTVELTGFVVHDNGSDYVARLVITCCAADATPMKVALTGSWAAPLPDDQWVRVDGTLRPGSATQANGYTPTLVTTAVHPVAEPADPYEH